MACCKCCSKKGLGICGWIFTIIFGLAAIAGIILGGLSFAMVDFSWITGTNWGALGAIAIAAIVIIGVATILGFIEFCCCKGQCCFTVLFLIIQMIVLLFALAIAIFGLISGAFESAVKYIGCPTEYKGVLDFWKEFDKLFVLIDQGLCSADCKCDFNTKTKAAFEANDTTKTVFASWIAPGTGTATSFLNCTTLIQTVEEKYNAFDTESKIKMNLTKFGDYWKFIENTFECTGFCLVNYDQDTANGVLYAGAYYKYLFNGINKGIVSFPGCLKSIVDYLPPLLKGYGSVGVVASVCCFLTWIAGCMLLCKCHKDEDEPKN